MKVVSLIVLFLFAVFCYSVFAETYVEEEFIVQGQPVTPTTVTTVPSTTTTVTTCPVTTTTIATTTGPIVLIPGEQDVYVGMSRNNAVEKLGQPKNIERFRRFTRRHHGVYDEVITYASPSGNLVLYVREGTVLKIAHE